MPADWKATLRKALAPPPRSDGAHHSLSDPKRHLWLGAKGAIREWVESGTIKHDPNADLLYDSVLDVLGKARKGDASKIRAVALAAAAWDDDITFYYGSLAEAYRNAKRLELLPA